MPPTPQPVMADLPTPAAAALVACDPIGFHGISWTVPAESRVGLTAGHAKRGRLVVAMPEGAAVVLGWERRGVTPDGPATARNLANRLSKDVGLGPVSTNALTGMPRDQGGIVNVRGPGGVAHGGWRYDHTTGTVLTVRQSGPGPESIVRDILQESFSQGMNAAWQWRIFGLRVDLPPGWTLNSLEALPGLSRGVWMWRPAGAIRTRAVVVMRRWGLADRVLAGHSLRDWLSSRLEPGEQIINSTVNENSVRLTTQRRNPPWVAWLWPRRRERTLWIWHEPENRLVVQEFAGLGPVIEPIIPILLANPQR